MPTYDSDTGTEIGRPSTVAVERPNPLAKAAQTAGAIWAGLGALVTALVGLGVLTSAQGDALSETGAALPGWLLAVGLVVSTLLTLGTGLASAFRTAAAGRPDVTPTSDPRDVDGVKLVRVDGAPLGGR